MLRTYFRAGRFISTFSPSKTSHCHYFQPLVDAFRPAVVSEVEETQNTQSPPLSPHLHKRRLYPHSQSLHSQEWRDEMRKIRGGGGGGGEGMEGCMALVMWVGVWEGGRGWVIRAGHGPPPICHWEGRAVSHCTLQICHHLRHPPLSGSVPQARRIIHQLKVFISTFPRRVWQLVWTTRRG